MSLKHSPRKWEGFREGERMNIGLHQERDVL